MSKPIIIHTIAAALILPLAGFAQDKTDPGKSGDAVKIPPSTAPARPSEPARAPGDAAREPGKSGDAAVIPDASTLPRQFMGPITAVSRDEKTITITDSKMGSHKLHIDETTKIKTGEKMGTWDDLKIGAKVDGTCRGSKNMAHAEMLTIKE